jgi:hypothetical protein
MSAQWFVKSVALLTFVGAASLPLSAQAVRSALPGTVNYVEGQVSINGNPLNTKQDGSIQVQPNQNLMTASGHAEMLLSPGVFVRSGSNSDIRLVSNGLANPAIEVVRGEAMVEVDQKAVDAQIDILEHGATASILKEGLYRFGSDQNRIEVVDGKLRVTENGQTKELSKGRELFINGEPLKTVGFDRKAEDDLYRWSSVRSAYLAEANMSTARTIYMGYDPYWGPGWYWNPYFTAWSWLPGDGFFYSPFGYPFFSPGYVVYARYGGYGFRGGFAGRTGVNLAARGGFAGGGFHGGGGGFHGGGGGGRR